MTVFGGTHRSPSLPPDQLKLDFEAQREQTGRFSTALTDPCTAPCIDKFVSRTGSFVHTLHKVGTFDLIHHDV